MACPYALTQPVGEPVDILEQRPILWSPAGAVDVARSHSRDVQRGAHRAVLEIGHSGDNLVDEMINLIGVNHEWRRQHDPILEPPNDDAAGAKGPSERHRVEVCEFDGPHESFTAYFDHGVGAVKLAQARAEMIAHRPSAIDQVVAFDEVQVLERYRAPTGCAL